MTGYYDKREYKIPSKTKRDKSFVMFYSSNYLKRKEKEIKNVAYI